MPYPSQEVTATTSVIRLYIANQFKEYELMSSTLRPLSRNKEPKNLCFNNAKLLAGAAATAAGAGADGTNGHGGGQGGAENQEAAD